MENYDFSGWATRANVKCTDGRTILKDAFKHNDGKKVPLVWNHQHNDPDEVLGHMILEHRDEGVYGYGFFNDSPKAKTAKIAVEHGDVDALSIYANQLTENLSMVSHGNIREVSLVLAGANIGAYIDNVIKHGEEFDDEAIIYFGDRIELHHSDVETTDKEDTVEYDSISHADDPEDNKEKNKKDKDDNKTIQDVIDTMNEEQKDVLYGLIGEALNRQEKESEESEETEELKGGDKNMKHNVFDQEETKQDVVLSHSDQMAIINDAKRYGSMKESFLAHVDSSSEQPGTYGIKGVDWLFPEAKNLNTPPEFINREMGWVKQVMGAVHHTPFSRIKSMFADLTEDEARAKGYIKGKLKKEQVFSLLKRTTTPTTVYKKQKMDRDDVIDITDFDVIAWLKYEMRMMLDEELARAYLVGDGRLASSDDKINEQCIRPIWTDEDLFTIKSKVAPASGESFAEAFIDQSVRAMKDYKGSGSPVAYMTEDVLTECLLLKDTNKHRLYKSADEVATAMRVSKIVTVPVMEGLTRTVGNDTHELKAIIVNLNDYNVGADKGGAVEMFDDFDIDYNQQKYLIETRCSGALIKPYSAIALETVVAAG